MKRKATGQCFGSGMMTGSFGAQTASGIFNNGQIEFFGQLADRFHVGAKAE